MLIVVAVWIAASYLIGIGFAVDQLRRPLPEWEAAGRNRRFWVSATFVMGFHGLGEYIAIAYLVGVVPRFGTADRVGPRLSLDRVSAALIGGWRRVERALPGPRSLTVTQQLVLVVALLDVAASVTHAVVIGPHFEGFWLFGAFFVVTALLQAVWAALIYRDPSNRRLLLAGAAGNAALIVVWAVSRTVGVPVGPGSWTPESVGVLDVLCQLDELAAVVLIAIVLRSMRSTGRALSSLDVRRAVMVTGPLFIYSVLASSGGHLHH